MMHRFFTFGTMEGSDTSWRRIPPDGISTAVAPQENEPVVDKRHSSAFQNTTLDEQLKLSRIDKLVIAGMQTEYCVDSACRAAAALGYQLVLVSDAHTTFDTPILSAEQIIAHHNLTLSDGFGDLARADQISF